MPLTLHIAVFNVRLLSDVCSPLQWIFVMLGGILSWMRVEATRKAYVLTSEFSCMCRINTDGVIDQVKSLFRGHKELILGFNTFLPKVIAIQHAFQSFMPPNSPNLMRICCGGGVSLQLANMYSCVWYVVISICFIVCPEFSGLLPYYSLDLDTILIYIRKKCEHTCVSY